MVALVEANRTDFEINVFDALTGEKRHTVQAKGTRDEGQPAFGVPGRVSAAVQHGRVVLLSRDKLQW